MPYYQQPGLVLPEHATIWRYMDYNRFESLIINKSLFFSRSDKQTLDKNEGRYPEQFFEHFEKEFSEKFPSIDGNEYTIPEWNEIKERRSRLISCWSIDEYESERRWAEYTLCNNAIAIKTNTFNLAHCFGKTKERICISKVRYGKNENEIAKNTHLWDLNHWLFPYLAKDETYRWENEIRAIVNISLERQQDFIYNDKGCYIEADIECLIPCIILNPKSQNDFDELVKEFLIENGFGNIKIEQSKLKY